MRPTVSIVLIMLSLTIFIVSCEDDEPMDEPCTSSSCQNGGVCVDGSCVCEPGYMGSTCSLFDPNFIQAFLDDGVTPFEIYELGIPMDSLYGKVYLDGYIFYLDSVDGSGYVAALTDQSDDAEWGCYEVDVSGVPNISNFPTEPETEEGARLGDGAANTDAILAEMCTNSSGTDVHAAQLCRDLGPEWFLPSREALFYIQTNLVLNGHGNFEANFYWSSTETDESFAWMTGLVNLNQGFADKELPVFVRAVRAF